MTRRRRSPLATTVAVLVLAVVLVALVRRGGLPSWLWTAFVAVAVVYLAYTLMGIRRRR